MGCHVIAVYENEAEVESVMTPDLLFEVLFQFLPKSEEWISVPDQNDLTGEHWTPKWTNILEAIVEIEKFLASPEAKTIRLPGFDLEELIDELQLFLKELQAASAHTERFHLCVY
jgi:hypothetical protein